MNKDAELEKPENLIGLLNKLVVPPEPVQVSLFPETIGWLFASIVLFIAAGGVFWFLVKRHKANAFRRNAIGSLHLAANDPEMLARIIRQTALATYPRAQVASLYGDDWVTFLERTGGRDPLRTDFARQIVNAPYKPSMVISDDLVKAVRHWILNHKRGPIS